MRAVDHLEKLIQLDHDALLTYRQALEHIGDPEIRADLVGFLQDHERHVRELTALVHDLGGTPPIPHRDLKGAVLEAMTRLRSRSGTLGALRAMRLNERLTNYGYERMAEVELPPTARALVAAGLADERRHLATIEAHIERLTQVATAA
jgi:rubrerythrin